MDRAAGGAVARGARVLWRSARWAAWVRVVSISTGVWLLVLSLTTECSHSTVYLREPAAPRVATDVPAGLTYRALLIGDAGHALRGSPVIAALAARASEAPELTSVLYLGDNIYTAGLPEPDHPGRAAAEEHLLAQIEPLASLGAELLFLPGNHDWDNSGPDGLRALARQQQFLKTHGTPRTQFVPADGDPGPVCIDRRALRIVALDSQWWLHSYERKLDVSAEDVLERLSECLRSAAGRHVLVAAHHPLWSNGPHGGFHPFTDHVFPLVRLHPWAYVPVPIIGSLYPLVRSRGVSVQDLGHERNQAMVAALRSVLDRERPLLFAAGHEHSLEVHRPELGPRFHVVSGAGSRTTPVTHDASTLFAVERLGFMELDIDHLEVARLRVYGVEGGQPHLLWERRLGRFAP